MREIIVQTGACAVVNVIKPQPSDSVAVFGLGGVGLSAVMVEKPPNTKFQQTSHQRTRQLKPSTSKQ